MSRGGGPGEGCPLPRRTGHLDCPGGRWCRWGGMPRGQGAGRKKLAVCQAAAEGGSGANLFRGSALTVAAAGHRLILVTRSVTIPRRSPRTLGGERTRRSEAQQAMRAHQAHPTAQRSGAQTGAVGQGVERRYLNRNGYQIRCRWPPGGRSRSPGGWPGGGGAVAVVAACRRGNGARAHRRCPLDHRWGAQRPDGGSDLRPPTAEPDRLAAVGRRALGHWVLTGFCVRRQVRAPGPS